MKSFSTAYAAHLAGNVGTLAICWQITKGDGSVVRGTQHDKDLTITGSPDGLFDGTYEARAGISGSDVKRKVDLSVDNMEVEGAFRDDSDTVTIDLTHDDIVANLYAMAPVIVFRVNWQHPSDYQEVVGFGWLGEITEDSTGHYKTEVRWAPQAYAQYFLRIYSDRCDVKHLGTGQCQFALAANTVSCTVTAVTDRRTFQASGYGAPAWSYARGLVKFTSGANSGFSREVQGDPRDNSGNVILRDEMPEDIAVGDAFTMEPGCPRTLDACKVFGQVVNFQGYGLYIPSLDLILNGPTGQPGQ
jgi:uncharacterized phage protein (TIGR02218 family)